MTLVCKSHGIGDSLINPIYRCSVKITPDINPIYVGIERSFPDNSKNMRLVWKSHGIGYSLINPRY